MHVRFVLYVYIIQAHRTRYVSHPSHMAIQKHLPRGTKQKLKTRSSKTAFSNHLKTTPGKEKKKINLPKRYPHKWTASFHIHQDLHAPMCVRMCVYECVCVYTRA